ncbi:TetR family transcriptional regulator [Glutamicibacter sp. M10]|uniref:TetR/AcrR family transcriptional regulator n=1 Tax=Glutamicibacter sp. M10 TaxID=3023076 RepID=UPI0021C573A5|nr:TetR family transcriptional regulator [Glutamicibacter sp. M10]UXN31717.1 TetR family transcriptional regulator [Glutamicibacter sp. M10]
MSDQDEQPLHKRPTGRRSGDSGTKEAILDAARELFSQRGYDSTSIRTIATSAGVDPALIRHFFGDKATLFATTLTEHTTIPQRLGNAFLGDPAHIGSRVVDTYLHLWEEEETRHIMLALVRSASTSNSAADMLKTVLGSRMRGVPQLSEADPDQSKRVALAAAHMLGIGFTRYVIQLPDISSRTHEEIVAEVGPTIQRYLTGTHR